jgi:hypothetical protein
MIPMVTPFPSLNAVLIGASRMPERAFAAGRRWHGICCIPSRRMIDTKDRHKNDRQQVEADEMETPLNDIVPKARTQARRFVKGKHTREKEDHSEGVVARAIEYQTARVPSDIFLWTALGTMACSALLMSRKERHLSLFVGQWAPAFLLMGLYNKIVKVSGSDRLSQSRPFAGGNANSGGGNAGGEMH